MRYLIENYRLIVKTFVLGVVFLMLHSGVWIMPNIGAEFTISQLWNNPTHLMVNFQDPLSQYVISQFLEPFLFSILNLHKQSYFMVFLFLENLFIYLIFTIWFLRFHNVDKNSIYKYFLSLCFPIFTLPLYWMGHNSMVLLLLLLSMIFYDSFLYYIFPFLLGFQSSSIGINAFFILGISLAVYKIFNNKFDYKIRYFKDKDVIKSFIGILLVLLGKSCLLYLFHKIGIYRTGTAFTWIEVYWKKFIRQWLLNWNTILYSIYGILWLYILKHIKTIWYIITPTILTFILVIIAADQTRIALLVLFPSLFYFILKNEEFFNKTYSKEAWIYVFVFFISPYIYVWGAPFAVSLIPDDLHILYILFTTHNLHNFNWNMPWL